MNRRIAYTGLFLLLTVTMCTSTGQAQQFDSRLPGAVANYNKPIVDFDIFRDRSSFPTDPRKPCNKCTQPPAARRVTFAGLNGQPFQEQEPGGCRCGRRNAGLDSTCFSIHWPRPFSARLDERFPEQASQRYSCGPKHKAVDIFDGFKNFKLINYDRTDNGYVGSNCRGKGADPYGCLGQSKLFGTPGRYEIGQSDSLNPRTPRVAKANVETGGYPLFGNQDSDLSRR